MMCDGTHQDAVGIDAEQHVEREAPHRTLANLISQAWEDEWVATDTVLCSLDCPKKAPPETSPASLIESRGFENLVVRFRMVDEFDHLRAANPARARS